MVQWWDSFSYINHKARSACLQSSVNLSCIRHGFLFLLLSAGVFVSYDEIQSINGIVTSKSLGDE